MLDQPLPFVVLLLFLVVTSIVVGWGRGRRGQGALYDELSGDLSGLVFDVSVPTAAEHTTGKRLACVVLHVRGGGIAGGECVFRGDAC